MDKPRILIVDDEADARVSIRNFVSRRVECEIDEACDGRQALEIIKNSDFDLILLDIKMQGISGMDVLRKTRVSHPGTDIIMITSYDSKQIAREAFKEGAVDFIIKPSTLEVIYSKVKHFLAKRNKYLAKDSKE